MADPATLSIAAVSAIAVKEGIKFLYGQAGEILKRWRERKDQADIAKESEPTAIVLPPVFAGQLKDPSIHFEEVARLEPTLRALYRDLSEYATDLLPVERTDADLLQKTDALRRIVEAILRQHLTFIGEDRPASGTLLSGAVTAVTVEGEVAGVDGEGKLEGEARGEVNVTTVKQGGKAVGVKWRI
jgi:hypothetical protein